MRTEFSAVEQTYDSSLERMRAKTEEVIEMLREQAKITAKILVEHANILASERLVLKTIESLLQEGSDGAADMAAQLFLDASSDVHTAKRRAYLLLDLAGRRSC